MSCESEAHRHHVLIARVWESQGFSASFPAQKGHRRAGQGAEKSKQNDQRAGTASLCGKATTFAGFSLEKKKTSVRDVIEGYEIMHSLETVEKENIFSYNT